MSDSFLLTLFKGTISTAEKAAILEGLNKLKEKKPELTTTVVAAGIVFLSALKDITDHTTSKMDDVFVNPGLEAVLQFQQENNIELPE